MDTIDEGLKDRIRAIVKGSTRRQLGQSLKRTAGRAFSDARHAMKTAERHADPKRKAKSMGRIQNKLLAAIQDSFLITDRMAALLDTADHPEAKRLIGEYRAQRKVVVRYAKAKLKAEKTHG